MRSVSAMLPVCAAMNRLATQDAKRLKDLAKGCADICRDCEVECRKHEFHHVECKRCAEACAATVKVLSRALGRRESGDVFGPAPWIGRRPGFDGPLTQ